MKHSILHITDLHLDNFDGTDEHLRRGYYKEYIDELVELINESALEVSSIVVTGDFVNQGKIENLENVKVILSYLANKLDVNQNQIHLCIGNHDFKYKDELPDGSNSEIVRKPYEDFTRSFKQKTIFENQRIKLVESENDVYYLSIDSTLGSHSPKIKGKPGVIKQEEIDEIVSKVLREKLPANSLLLIGCHYPIVAFPSGLPADGENNWEENHLWKSANALRTRINKIKSINKIWFMGDCHIPDHIQFEEAYFIMTGKFGGTTKISKIKYFSHIPRQCKIVSFCTENDQVPVHTFSFEAATHIDNPNYGKWSLKKSVIRSFRSIVDQNSVQKDTGSIFHLIHAKTEESIITRIKEKDLYSFGRFVTSENNTSLGWVNMNQLLNSSELLSNIVDKSLKYISDKLNIDFSSCVIIGLDFWGSIIGSQISVRTGMKNFAVATRGNGQYHSYFELSNTYLENELLHCREVVFVIDVISCGDTLNKLVNNCFRVNENLVFHVISVISNASTIKIENFSNIKSAGTFCENLRIPVMRNEELPDDDFLPPSIDLSPRNQKNSL